MDSIISYITHNKQYMESSAFDRENEIHQNNNKNITEVLYKSDTPHGRILDSHNFDVCIDIGSGTGWFANYLVRNRNFKKVYAIEPSAAAINIAKRIYGEDNRVEYMCGFAEDIISSLKIDVPVFISTMTVLAHIPNDIVEKIVRSLSSVTKSGSIYCASEPWGESFTYPLWNIRDKSEWSSLFNGWKIEFEENYTLPWPCDKKRYKGFVAYKQ